MTDPPRSPCWSKNRYMLNSDGSKKSDGASHFTQSEDCDRLQRAEGCQPGRCLYASISQESGTQRPTGVTTLTREPFYTAYLNGVLHCQCIAANTARISWRIQISSRLQQYSDWIASLSKIDPHPAQLNYVDQLGLVALSTQLAYLNQQPFTAVF